MAVGVSVLPSVAEATSIAQARLTPTGQYWTEIPSDAANDGHLVYDSKRKRLRPHAANWTGARALCVRNRHLDRHLDLGE